MKDLPQTMKAAVCKGPGAALEIEEVYVPRPNEGQVLVKLESRGVCYSDLHLREDTLPDDF